MNPIKCTNNIINNLLRALKVILKKNYAKIHKYVCIQASSLLLYRVTDRRVKLKNIRVSKKNHNNLFLRERNNERKNDPIFTHKRTVSKAQLIKAFIIYQSIFQS